MNVRILGALARGNLIAAAVEEAGHTPWQPTAEELPDCVVLHAWGTKTDYLATGYYLGRGVPCCFFSPGSHRLHARGQFNNLYAAADTQQLKDVLALLAGVGVESPASDAPTSTGSHETVLDQPAIPAPPIPRATERFARIRPAARP